ncbi:uncharacterized protein TNCV_4428921 [Trichonephila clavipes]|nr:uncharacterized protein TNCV_4428921 [Trichonephila clavipes]
MASSEKKEEGKLVSATENFKFGESRNMALLVKATERAQRMFFCSGAVLKRVPLRMDFTEINSRGKRGELLGRIDRQNSRFRTAKTIIIKFGLHASFVELESAKNAVNEKGNFWRERDDKQTKTDVKGFLLTVPEPSGRHGQQGLHADHSPLGTKTKSSAVGRGGERGSQTSSRTIPRFETLFEEMQLKKNNKEKKE